MSEADSKAPPTDISVESVSPIMLNGKASAAAPKLSDNDDNVEMKNMLSSGSETQLDEDIMQLARLGNIPAIQKLFDAGRFHPTYCDTEGITPLHVWFCMFCRVNPD
jgi:palmitoyltransferase ZDHHC13/17